MKKINISRLSSPCGDKLQSGSEGAALWRRSYRPLAGISCNVVGSHDHLAGLGYRPLAGISCNFIWMRYYPEIRTLSSPCGDKLQ